MVWTIVENVRHAVKYRGGWWPLIIHMYTNGDYPFKFGTYMGTDGAGNRYYENRVDYPFGQHRWVEPADINNFDSTQVPPEWHGWMMHMNDATPTTEAEYIQEKLNAASRGERISHAPYQHNLGQQNRMFHFNHMHNQSQVRSRGYGIGNPIVNLPPGVKDAYYTQPGSPYNDASIRKFGVEGDLDAANGGGRPYKNEMWKRRLMTADEVEAERQEENEAWTQLEASKTAAKKALTPRERAILARGGTLS